MKVYLWRSRKGKLFHSPNSSGGGQKKNFVWSRGFPRRLSWFDDMTGEQQTQLGQRVTSQVKIFRLSPRFSYIFQLCQSNSSKFTKSFSSSYITTHRFSQSKVDEKSSTIGADRFARTFPMQLPITTEGDVKARERKATGDHENHLVTGMRGAKCQRWKRFWKLVAI